MDSQEKQDRSGQYRIVGEDTPRWFTIGFTVIGTVIAAAAAWLWLTQQPQFQEEREQANAPAQEEAVATAPTDTSPPSLLPVQSPAETPGENISEHPTVERGLLAQEGTVGTVPSAIDPLSVPPEESPAEKPGEIIAENQPVERNLPAQQETVASAPSAIDPLSAPPEESPAETPDDVAEEDQAMDAQVEPASLAVVTADDIMPSQLVSVPTDPPIDKTIQTTGQMSADREACPANVTIFFDFRSATPIMSSIEPDLEELTNWLKDHPEAKASVEGHADSVGSGQYNLLLSYQRAKAVATLLSDSGIPMQRIIITAAGSHNPIEGIPTTADANRRVILQVVNIDCQQTSR